MNSFVSENCIDQFKFDMFKLQRLLFKFFFIKLVYICCFICFGAVDSINAQSNSELERDSLIAKLQLYKTQDSFKLYYYTLREIDDIILQQKSYDRISSMNKYYKYLPSNKVDSSVFRRFTMYHGEKIKKYQNDYWGALQYYILAHEHVYDEKQLDKWSFWIENTIGNIYARLNDYDKAVYYYNMCLISCSKNKKQLSRIYANIGNAYRWMSNHKMTEFAFDNGIALGKEANSIKGLQAIHTNYADYYLDLDSFKLFNAHISKAKKHLSNLEQLRSYADRKCELFELEGDGYMKMGDYKKAIKLYNQSIDGLLGFMHSSRSRELAKLHHKLSNVYFEMSNLSLTNKHILEGFKLLINDFTLSELPLRSQVTKENTFTDLLSTKAKYYFFLYKEKKQIVYLDSALLAVDLAIEANSQLDEMLVLYNSKYESIAQNKTIVNQAVDYCYQAHIDLKSPRYLNKVRYYLDLSKSQLLMENQEKKQLLHAMSTPDKIILNNLEQKLIHLQESSVKSSFRQNLQVNYNEKIQKIQEKYIRPHNLDHCILEPYLEYIMTANSYYLYTNIRTGTDQFIRIGSISEIDTLIWDVLKLIKNKDQNLLKQLTKLYYQLIPFDIEDQEELTVIPDGNIAFVPFDILRAENSFLLENTVIKWRYHTKAYEVPKAKTLPQKMYVLKPNYTHEILSKDDHNSRFTYLPYAKRELDSIIEVFNIEYSIDSSVNLTRLKNKLANNDIFHFTGHAIVTADSSYMLLRDKDKNIKLTAKQIFYLTNNMDLVTLSACETGLGMYKNGEGVRSLANAFLNSGTNAIVYSLWNANDISTSKIMTNFYRNLELGWSKPKALNLAKIEFLNNANPLYQHPFYWAAFIIADNMEYHTDSHFNAWSSGIIMIILLILILYFFKHKTKQL